MPASRSTELFAVLLCAASLISCTDRETSLMEPTYAPQYASSIAAPTGLVTVTIGSDELTIYPVTSRDIPSISDPVNLIFAGQVDPRSLRAALMALDGDRSGLGLPNVYPFNCTWQDAHGEMQAVYANDWGWSPNVVQVACGSYGPVRFHLRLFPVGDYTLGGAHFEVQIPGTADHRVLAWDLARDFVIGDFARTGLLGALPAPTAAINPTTFKTVEAALYNELPSEIRALIGGPAGNVESDWGVPTDGAAVILTLAGAADLVAGSTSETLTVEYGQVIPRPFCSSGPLDYVFVSGPVTLSRSATQGSDGTMISEVKTYGKLTVTPVDPLNGFEAIGESTTALINEISHAVIGDHGYHVNSKLTRKEIGVNGIVRTGLQTRLQLGRPGREFFSYDESCGKE